MQRTTWTRLLALAALAALLAGTDTASAAKGGNRTTYTVAFDDYAGDAILSDGLGPYTGSVNRDGALVVTTGTRSLYVDFGWGTGFQELTGVTVTVSTLAAGTATADFEFTWPDPYSGHNTSWLVTMTVSVAESGGAYRLAAASDAEVWWLDMRRGTWGLGHMFGPVWERESVSSMPWGATVSR